MSVPVIDDVRTFADIGVPADLVAVLTKAGITQPFDIQAATIPDALAGRDVCGRAPTGSGKTIAFGVPLIARIDRARKRQPTALILAPTRELTAQICRELEPLASARCGGVSDSRSACGIVREGDHSYFQPASSRRR